MVRRSLVTPVVPLELLFMVSLGTARVLESVAIGIGVGVVVVLPIVPVDGWLAIVEPIGIAWPVDVVPWFCGSDLLSVRVVSLVVPVTAVSGAVVVFGVIVPDVAGWFCGRLLSPLRLVSADGVL